MLRLERMNRVLEVDRGAGLAKVEGGIVIRDLSEALAREGLALENLGDIDVQTVAGAISTATHGTGERFGNISSQVEALELVTADGSVVECSRESDPDLWRAARVGLGSLGAIATVTLPRACRPSRSGATTTRCRSRRRSRGSTSWPRANDHFEFYVFPHTRTALCRESKHIDGAAGAARPGRGVPARDGAREPRPRGCCAGSASAFPARIPAINRLITRTLAGSVKTDASHRVFSTAAPGALHRDGVRGAARRTGPRRFAACST